MTSPLHKHALKLISAALLAAVAALASTPAFTAEGVIAEIKVEGNRRVETDAVTAEIKVAPGSAFDQAAVSEDIRRLYETGLFSDVTAFTEQTDEGLVLIYEVKEHPTITKIEISGNDEIDTEDIEKAIDIKPMSILDMNKVLKNVTKIRDLYLDKGFFLSEVNYRLELNAVQNEAVLHFVIKEHAKVVIKKITILGNTRIDDDDIRGVMETREGGWFSFITSSGEYKEEAFQRDLMRIQQLYRDRGYIKIKVGTPLLELSPDKKHMFITVGVEEGDQYRVGKISFRGDLDITGDPEALERLLRRMIVTKPGDIFNVSQFFHFDLNRVTDFYKNHGYAWVNITTPYDEHPAERLLDVTLDIQKGPICSFEKIEVIGNTKTRDKVIRRELRIYEAERFSAAAIEHSKARLNALGYFEKVEINYRRGSADDLVDVTIEVKEKPTGSFQIGAGFSSAENFMFQAQISQYNLFGRGQQLTLSAQISSIRKLFDLSFVEPYFLDSEWTLAADLYNTYWDYYEFIRTSTGGRLTLGHSFPKVDALKGYFTYTLETVSVESTQSIEYAVRLKNMYQRGLTSSLTLKLVYDTRNNRITPSAGMFHTASVEFSPWFLGSQNQFIRTFLTGRWYIPIIWGIVAKVNANLGWITSMGNSVVPISERFYVGGVNSIRGYNLRSISPTILVAQQGLDPDSALYEFMYGGNKELIFNFEIEFPIVEKLGLKGVVFADAGNSYGEDEYFFYDRTYQLPIGLLYSVGFGVRWFSPIGPLRFEWGFPLTRRFNVATNTYLDDVYRFEFTIGNFF